MKRERKRRAEKVGREGGRGDKRESRRRRRRIAWWRLERGGVCWLLCCVQKLEGWTGMWVEVFDEGYEIAVAEVCRLSIGMQRGEQRGICRFERALPAPAPSAHLHTAGYPYQPPSAFAKRVASDMTPPCPPSD